MKRILLCVLAASLSACASFNGSDAPPEARSLPDVIESGDDITVNAPLPTVARSAVDDITVTSDSTVPPPPPPPPPPIDIPGDVLFETNSAELRPEARVQLAPVVADLLAAIPNGRLIITGHTDSRGSPQDNQDLSLRRAFSVAAFFIESGFDPSQVVANGSGELEPVVEDSPGGEFDESLGARNRRVTIQPRRQ